MLKKVSELIGRGKVRGKELASEVFIKKKRQCLLLVFNYF